MGFFTPSFIQQLISEHSNGPGNTAVTQTPTPVLQGPDVTVDADLQHTTTQLSNYLP